jgi:hypothetical protein
MARKHALRKKSPERFTNIFGPMFAIRPIPKARPARHSVDCKHQEMNVDVAAKVTGFLSFSEELSDA